MTKLLRPPKPISVTTADGQVVAGQTLDVTVGLVADRALEVADGEVELIRRTAVTRLGRNWTGAGSRVSFRSSSVISRADMGIVGPLTPGQSVERQLAP
jgi:hypothetical protein